MTAPSCLFCKIVAGEIPATVVATSERSIAFRDLTPVAPTHVLVIPREHHNNLVELAAEPDQLADLVLLAGQVAEQEDLDRGYRLVANTGNLGGQTVYHIHLHVLGGRQMQWPPG